MNEQRLDNALKLFSAIKPKIKTGIVRALICRILDQKSLCQAYINFLLN